MQTEAAQTIRMKSAIDGARSITGVRSPSFIYSIFHTSCPRQSSPKSRRQKPPLAFIVTPAMRLEQKKGPPLAIGSYELIESGITWKRHKESQAPERPKSSQEHPREPQGSFRQCFRTSWLNSGSTVSASSESLFDAPRQPLRVLLPLPYKSLHRIHIK